MSSQSEQSTLKNPSNLSNCIPTYQGFPEKCVCGLGAKIYTSKTQENPGKRFFRCPSKREDHLFKWVEEAVFEEVVQAKSKVRGVAIDILEAKTQMEEMKAAVEDLKEEIAISKLEIRMVKRLMKLCVLFLCVGIIILVGLKVLA